MGVSGPAGRDHEKSTALVATFVRVLGALVAGCGSGRRPVTAIEEVDRIETERPSGIAVSPPGEIYVSSSRRNTVRRFDATGKLMDEWGEAGGADRELDEPTGIDVDGEGDVYVVHAGRDPIQVFDREGAFLRSWGHMGTSEVDLAGATGVAVDTERRVYITDAESKCVHVFDHLGGFIRQWGKAGQDRIGDFGRPWEIAVDSAGAAYVCDPSGMGSYTVQVFPQPGTGQPECGVSGPSNDPLGDVEDVAVDALGAIYMVERLGCRVRVKPSLDQVETKAAPWVTHDLGPDSYPDALALAPDGKRLYVASFAKNLIYVLSIRR